MMNNYSVINTAKKTGTRQEDGGRSGPTFCVFLFPRFHLIFLALGPGPGPRRVCLWGHKINVFTVSFWYLLFLSRTKTLEHRIQGNGFWYLTFQDFVMHSSKLVHHDYPVCLITERCISVLVLSLLVLPVHVRSCRWIISHHTSASIKAYYPHFLHPPNSRASFFHPDPSTHSLQAGLLLQRWVHQVSAQRGHHILPAAGRGHDPLHPGRGT